jgi:hypothetical protein
MRTILFIKETSDQDPDFVNLELKDFFKLREEDLAKAYNKLSKVCTPIFSGAVNTMINKIDPTKVEDVQLLPEVMQQALIILLKGANHKKNGKKNWSDLNSVESEIFEELKHAREQLEKKRMMYGMWNVLK